ncbi:MAG: hypothetical protein IIB38_12565 [Candidatus Hydrogenedentes bacterium]|nr:hypothetical protein [Candidatus Hydrogenedentota bacterium]
MLAVVHPDYAYAVQSFPIPHSGPAQIVLPWGGIVRGKERFNGKSPWGGRVSVFDQEGHADSRLKAELESDGSFELWPVPSGEIVIQVQVTAGERLGWRNQKSIYVESGKTTFVDFEFFLGTSTIFGEIHAESDGWRRCSVRLLPQNEAEGTQYNIVAEQTGFFQIDNVLPGLYVVEAEVQLVPGSVERLRYSGEVVVPEEGEVRHDITLFLDE